MVSYLLNVKDLVEMSHAGILFVIVIVNVNYSRQNFFVPMK